MLSRGLLTIGLVVVLGPLGSSWSAEPSAADLEFFEKEVRPLLQAKCVGCHGPEKQKAGLRLDSKGAVLAGGESGPAAVPGKPAESLLIDAVNYGETVQMPPRSRLAAGEVEALTKWVAMGMPWPGASPTSLKTIAAGQGFDLKARREAHWAWKPVKGGEPPAVKDAEWPRDPVDRFLLARLEAKGIKPAEDADRRSILRRLSFDLNGLPPTPSEVEAFRQDQAPGAVERVVDRLLASPRFGERWGRHWLDLVRYAETRGHEFDPDIPNAFRYRDYVIRALNDDVPYDQFLKEHLAGDLVQPPRIDPKTGDNLSVLGTGFWFLGEEVHSPVDVRQDECDRMDNRLDVMSKTFLGLTVSCARCHDHKFDAISQRDYYALNGFLLGGSYRQVRYGSIERERAAAEALRKVRDEARRRVLAIAAGAAMGEAGRLSEELLAARGVLLGAPLDRGGTAAVVPERLRRWADELGRARADRKHPWHAFAAGACVIGDGRPFAERMKAFAPTAPKAAVRILADYTARQPLTSTQDGFAFGVRPARAGDLSFASAEAGRPPFRVLDRGGFVRDPWFRKLGLDEGTQRDHGRLGTWERAGQTLRTAEFSAGSGKLWYLAKGAGRAYAAVNSHLIVAGPLHAGVMTEWTDGDKGWRWVRHDLSAYPGHRMHVEFCPSGPGDLALAMVVESAAMPPLPEESSAPLGVDSPEGLARALQNEFADVVERMAGDAIETEPKARVADWILQNLEWLTTAGPEASEAIRGEARKLAETEVALAKPLAASSATAPAMLEGSGVDEFLLIRGASKSPGALVPRRFLEAIAGDVPISSASGSGRLELAEAMVAASNPFASRVIVNRVWHHLFGRGLVATVDNFGVMGEAPSHPELLDDLADRFVKDGWSIKGLIRELVLTRAYGMSSRADASADALDPNNLLLHKMPIRRLEAEPIRDAILAMSGRLDGRLYGPSVSVHLTSAMQGRGRPGTSGPMDGAGRRSLYLAIRRNFLAPMMLAFDAPIPFSTVGRRNVSNVPAQALILMNDPFVVEQARLWARRLLIDPSARPEGRIAMLYREAFARPATGKEVAEAIRFLEEQGDELKLKPGDWERDESAWADLVHVLINAKEFVFLD